MQSDGSLRVASINSVMTGLLEISRHTSSAADASMTNNRHQIHRPRGSSTVEAVLLLLQEDCDVYRGLSIEPFLET